MHEVACSADPAADLVFRTVTALKWDSALLGKTKGLREALSSLLQKHEALAITPEPKSRHELRWIKDRLMPFQSSIELVRRSLFVESGEPPFSDSTSLLNDVNIQLDTLMHSQPINLMVGATSRVGDKIVLHGELPRGQVDECEKDFRKELLKSYCSVTAAGLGISWVLGAAAGSFLAGVVISALLYRPVTRSVENYWASRWFEQFGHLKVQGVLQDVNFRADIANAFTIVDGLVAGAEA